MSDDASSSCERRRSRVPLQGAAGVGREQEIGIEVLADRAWGGPTAWAGAMVVRRLTVTPL